MDINRFNLADTRIRSRSFDTGIPNGNNPNIVDHL